MGKHAIIITLAIKLAWGHEMVGVMVLTERSPQREGYRVLQCCACRRLGSDPSQNPPREVRCKKCFCPLHTESI